jgi:hypothetical protein
VSGLQGVRLWTKHGLLLATGILVAFTNLGPMLTSVANFKCWIMLCCVVL